MPDKSVNPQTTVQPEDSEAAFRKALDARLVRALETRPEITVPAEFAARVASRMPSRRPALLRRTHYGQWVMVLSLVVLAAALAAMVAGNFGRTPIGLAMEGVIYAQLLSLAVWLGIRRAGLRS